MDLAFVIVAGTTQHWHAAGTRLALHGTALDDALIIIMIITIINYDYANNNNNNPDFSRELARES